MRTALGHLAKLRFWEIPSPLLASSLDARKSRGQSKSWLTEAVDRRGKYRLSHETFQKECGPKST